MGRVRTLAFRWPARFPLHVIDQLLEGGAARGVLLPSAAISNSGSSRSSGEGKPDPRNPRWPRLPLWRAGALRARTSRGALSLAAGGVLSRARSGWLRKRQPALLLSGVLYHATCNLLVLLLEASILPPPTLQVRRRSPVDHAQITGDARRPPTPTRRCGREQIVPSEVWRTRSAEPAASTRRPLAVRAPSLPPGGLLPSTLPPGSRAATTPGSAPTLTPPPRRSSACRTRARCCPSAMGSEPPCRRRRSSNGAAVEVARSKARSRPHASTPPSSANKAASRRSPGQPSDRRGSANCRVRPGWSRRRDDGIAVGLTSVPSPCRW